MNIIAQSSEVTAELQEVLNAAAGVAVAGLAIWGVFYAFDRLRRGGELSAGDAAVRDYIEHCNSVEQAYDEYDLNYVRMEAEGYFDEFDPEPSVELDLDPIREDYENDPVAVATLDFDEYASFGSSSRSESSDDDDHEYDPDDPDNIPF